MILAIALSILNVTMWHRLQLSGKAKSSKRNRQKNQDGLSANSKGMFKAGDFCTVVF